MYTRNLRAKKRNNAHTLTIRTQWAKTNDPAYLNPINTPFEEWLEVPLKSNPNTTRGFYMPTAPNKPDDDIPYDDRFDDDFYIDLLDDEDDSGFNTDKVTKILYNTNSTGEIADEVDELFNTEIVEYIDPEIVEYLTNLWNKEVLV